MTKERFLGLRLTGSLAEALEEYARKEERSLSSAVRYLLAKELARLGFLEDAKSPAKKPKT
jgi:hypothetical protein